jgi:hypothetical protein
MAFSIDIQNVVGTSIDADGFQSTQWDADGENDAGVTAGQAHHLFGSWGRAPDGTAESTATGAAGAGSLDPSKSAQCFVIHEGGTAHLLDLQHVPTMAIVPTPLGGEHVTYSTSGCFTRHHLDGSVSMATTDAGGGPSGQAIFFRVRPTERVYNAPWCRETYDATGMRWKHAGGARMALGYISGGPFPAGKSYFRTQSDLVEINGAAVSIGPTGSAQQPVAQAAPLVSVLGTLVTAMQTLTAAMGTITTTTPGATAAATALPAVQAAAASVASALTTISTQTAIG